MVSFIIFLWEMPASPSFLSPTIDLTNKNGLPIEVSSSRKLMIIGFRNRENSIIEENNFCQSSNILTTRNSDDLRGWWDGRKRPLIQLMSVIISPWFVASLFCYCDVHCAIQVLPTPKNKMQYYTYHHFYCTRYIMITESIHHKDCL